MEITEVRIKLMEESGERLQAFCSITFDDCFVIRDLKIIESDEVAPSVVFLATDAANRVTGSTYDATAGDSAKYTA